MEQFLNRTWATLASGIDAVTTSMPLTTGHGARFGTITAGNYIRVDMLDASLNVSETIYITGITGDNATIERGKDGTTATTHLAGDRIEARIGKSTMDALAPKTGNSSQTFSVANGTTTNHAVNYGQVFGTPRTIQKFTSGSGTYTTPTGCVAIKVRMVGGGGGGSGSGTTLPAGTAGGNSTFGGNTAGGGGGGGSGVGQAGAGGAPTILVGVGVGIQGSMGSSGSCIANAATFSTGGAGGTSPFGGAGGGLMASNGAAAYVNSGSGGGGGGGGNTANVYAGNAGGSGAYLDFLITAPASTYTYAVGAGGAGGAAGTSGLSGGAGGSGLIIVEEYYV